VSEQDPSAPSPEGRVSTGTETLDVMLHGGFVAKRPYLVVGPAGTGKTTLALQFLCDGIRRGERCLIVTLEEPPNEMRMNHRSLLPDLDEVYVFDAIPDVMRYERAPFKDIAAVRQSVPFSQVPMQIRKTPELSSVEVTFTALEQTLKMEMARRNFQRIVIDSLTALQYFCMKGFDETLGAQTFLRFLSDLRVTTFLTVEAPLEDSETPERLLARGEIRLFRWEHDARTVRAIGVEKFRGSEHDARLHPYRISPRGLDINLALTISRDTQELWPSTIDTARGPSEPPEPPEVFATSLASLEQDSRDLIAVGVDVGAIRSTVLEALAASERSTAEEVARIVARARGRVLEIVARIGDSAPPDGSVKESPAMRRLRARLAAARMGIPPSGPPDLATLRPMLEKVLDALEPAVTITHPPPAPTAVAIAPEEGGPSSPPVHVVAPAARPAPAPPMAPPPVAPATVAPLPEATPPPPPPPPPMKPPVEVGPPEPAPTATVRPALTSLKGPPAVGTAPTARPGAEPTKVAPVREVTPPKPLATKGAPPAPPSRSATKVAAPPARVPPSPTSPAERSSPPPLPSAGMAGPPRPSPPSSAAPVEPTRPAHPEGAGAPPVKPGVLPIAPLPEAVPASPPEPTPTAEAASPKRRRKTVVAGSTTPKKRASRASKSSSDAAADVPSVAPTEPAPSPAAAVAAPDSSVSASGESGPTATAGDQSAAKPKRRAPRRKAPPVTAAEPGPPPPEEERVAADGAAPPAPTEAPSTANENPPDGA